MQYKRENAIQIDIVNPPTADAIEVNEELNTSVNTFTMDIMASYAEVNDDIAMASGDDYDVDTEMQQYLEEANASIDISILSWWAERAIKFPTLSLLARFIFSIPASSAAPNRSFSDKSHEFSKKRTSLSTSTVENILICNSNSDLLDENTTPQ